MAHNEVLEEEDVADGYILACQAVPLTDTVRRHLPLTRTSWHRRTSPGRRRGRRGGPPGGRRRRSRPATDR